MQGNVSFEMKAKGNATDFEYLQLIEEINYNEYDNAVQYSIKS